MTKNEENDGIVAARGNLALAIEAEKTAAVAAADAQTKLDKLAERARDAVEDLVECEAKIAAGQKAIADALMAHGVGESAGLGAQLELKTLREARAEAQSLVDSFELAKAAAVQELTTASEAHSVATSAVTHAVESVIVKLGRQLAIGTHKQQAALDESHLLVRAFASPQFYFAPDGQRVAPLVSHEVLYVRDTAHSAASSATDAMGQHVVSLVHKLDGFRAKLQSDPDASLM
jgi:hypothetical protein